MAHVGDLVEGIRRVHRIFFFFLGLLARQQTGGGKLGRSELGFCTRTLLQGFLIEMS
jgi:hypothetical protein